MNTPPKAKLSGGVFIFTTIALKPIELHIYT